MAKLAVIFPGQGAQYSGMGSDLYQEHSAAREVFDTSGKALGYDLAQLCFHGSDEELKLTERTQPAILAHSLAAWAVLRSFLRPGSVQAMAGLSLGEFSALVASGVLSLSEAITTVRERGAAMQDAVPVGIGAMAAVLGMAAEPLEKIVAQVATKHGCVEVANYNSPGQIVISGLQGAVEAAIEELKAAGASRAVLLPVSAPFHSSLLQPAAQRLAQVLDTVHINSFTYPVIANVTASAYPGPEEVKELLIRQVTSSVRWDQTVRLLLSEGIDTFIEVGPGRTLCQFIKRIAKETGHSVTLTGLDKLSDLVEIEETLRKAELHVES